MCISVAYITSVANIILLIYVLKSLLNIIKLEFLLFTKMCFDLFYGSHIKFNSKFLVKINIYSN